MNPGSRDTPTEEKTQRLGSGDGHTHSKAGGSLVMHDHGRRSPASAHSPGMPAKLPGLHPDSGRTSRGFGMPTFSTAGLSPAFNFEHHLPLILNSAASRLIFPSFLHPSPSPLFPPVLPPNFLPPPLQAPLPSLFPSPNAECEASSGGWSAHSGGSRNTSSLGSSSSEGDTAAKIDGRTVRSSRCSPDMNLQPTSLSSSVPKIWDSSVMDPVCVSDADMPLSLVTRRETTSRGSSAAESGVCTGDSLARAASSETSRTPSLDGESSCHPVTENSGVQEQTVPADQPTQWPAGKAAAETAEDGKSSASDDVWSSGTAASRSSGIALPPRKRLTRNAEELTSSTPRQTASSSVAAGSPSSAPNFRSCWKKFSAKSNVSGPSSHRTFGSKPQYDCRTYFQKLAEQARAAAASKAFVPGKGKGHCYRNANKASPRSSDQNAGSPRVTRSQSKPKKTQSPKSSPAEPPAPVRKSTRKKSINTRFEEYDRTVGKNKKSKSLSLDSNATASDAGKETSLADGDEVTPNAEKNSQRKNRRRGKQVKGESFTDADLSSTCADTEDSTSQSQLTSDVPPPVSEPDSKLSSVTSYSVFATTHEGSELNAKTEDAFEPEPSTVVTVLPPKFRHFRTKTAATMFDSSQPPTNSDHLVTTPNESSSSEIAASVKDDSTEPASVVVQPVSVATEGEGIHKSGLPTSAENSTSSEMSAGHLAEESKASQSHSVGGRKSLLYRSSATTDSQPTTEAKLTLTGSQTECSGSVGADAATDASVDQTSADVRYDKTTVLSEDASAVEHGRVLLEESQALPYSTEPEVESAESNEKVHDDAEDVRSQQHMESVPTSSSDIVSCKSASLTTADVDLKASTASSAVSNTTSDYPSAVADEKCESASELGSSALSVHSETQRLDGSHEAPADSLDERDSQSKIEPCEGNGDVLVKSGSQSVQSQSTELVSTATVSVLDEPRLSTTPVTSAAETSDLSCRIKPADVDSSSVDEAPSKSGSSLKRLLPDDVAVNDDAKRRRASSIDRAADRLPVDAVSQPLSSTSTPTTNTTVNLTLSSGELDSQTCPVPNNKSYTVTTGKLQSSLSTSIQISLKPERLKPDRSKGRKANRKLKPNRSYRAVKNVAIAEPPVLQKSNSSTAETIPAESESDTNNEKSSLLETPDSSTTAIVKYAVANSVDKMCDTNTDVCSMQNGNEQKTLRISLIAINESNTAGHRVKDTRSESVCNSDNMSNSSPTVPVYTATTAAVHSLDRLRSGGSLVDSEPLVASAGLSQDSATLERDRSALLSQCKALSVVLEKMRNNNNASLPDSVRKPTGRQRRGGLLRRHVGRSTKPEVSADDLSLTAEKPQAAEPLPSASVDDAYRFPDDVLSDSLPLQRVPRPERRTSGRKVRSVQPTANHVELSPAAASDSSSRGAASSVDSSMASGNSGARSLTPNAVQKVPAKSETGAVRTRRRRHNLQEDEDTRSLSPFAQNGSLPAPIVEASLDGHKLKLRIMKCANRSSEDSACDTKVSIPPSSPVELTDSRTKLKDDEVRTPDPEPPPAVEVSPGQVSRRRRQLKVEGVRSRFLTLHKPSGVVPSADHVKCRLVKVGRRHWMSVGGEEPDDDSSAAQQSDSETPVKNSPAAPSVEEMAEHPTRDRLLLVNEKRKQRTATTKCTQPSKAKTDSTEASPSVASAKRTKKKVKMSVSRLQASTPKPEPPREVVSRPARVDPVPWLDCETDGSETQPYSALGDTSSRTITTDLDEYRLCVSTSAECTSDIDLVISDALSDCGVELACDTLLAPRSMYFVPSELERLMEALVLDDQHHRPRVSTPPATVVAPETHILSSTSRGRTFSYGHSVSSPVISPRHDGELDLLISQPSLRLRNCTLPVDANDSSDYDCTIVGYEHPACCYPDAVELPSLFDHQLIDEDYSLSACLSDTQLYSCVDFVL